MTADDVAYFAHPGLNKSSIDLLLDCPARYKAMLDGAEEEKDTAALRFGSLCHTLTLQPETFADQYAMTHLDLRTKDGKLWRESLPEGVQPISVADYEKAQMMADAVRDHPQARVLFAGENYTAEKAIFWEWNGVECKAKPDIVTEVQGRRFIVDLKTTESVEPDAIAKSIAKWGYHRQAAWYLLGMESIGKPCAGFLFAFVEKAYPHLVTMCQLDAAALERGLQECARAVEILKECRASGKWPCYTREIIEISLPRWA